MSIEKTIAISTIPIFKLKAYVMTYVETITKSIKMAIINQDFLLFCAIKS